MPDLFSQLINFVWLHLTASIKRICYVTLCYDKEWNTGPSNQHL